MVSSCFPDERLKGGELDLDGIDDQEIEKVILFLSTLACASS